MKLKEIILHHKPRQFAASLVGFCLCFFAFAPGNAQSVIPEQVKEQFNRYQVKNLEEKLFVHLDKSFYLAGETIWFKLYDVDESFHRPLGLSRVAYIEILNGEEKPILQTKVEMTNGTGNGSLTLPASLSSGNFIFRAYTAWMKNSSPDFYFQEAIAIVNTFKSAPPKENESKQKYSIQFFPEGGNLVNGLNSKVAFKAVDQNGKGIPCSGWILNQKKDTLALFEASRLGMGNFQLTPQQADQYYAVVKIMDSQIVQNLPPAYNEGYVMQVSDSLPDKIRIRIRATKSFFNTPVYLFTHTRNLYKNVQSGEITKGEAVFWIDQNALGEGISVFTVFNGSGRPVCERLYFRKPENNLIINVKTDQAAYSIRNKLNIEISTRDTSRQPVSANMSMAVFRIDSLQRIPQLNIINYLLLTSDLIGNIESPEYYFENQNKDAGQAMENLLLTQGWRRFNWNDILENRSPAPEFLPEPEGLLIYGRVVDKRTGNGGSHITGYASIPGQSFEYSSSVSDPDGKIRFNLGNYSNYHTELIVQTAYQTDSNYRIDITNPFSDRFSKRFIPKLVLSKKQETDLLNRSIDNQVENAYRIRQKHQYHIDPYADSTAFYGIPDRGYYLADYTRFVTLEEVLREYVLDVRVRKESDQFHLKVRNGLFENYFENDPLILLDGVPVSDPNKVMALNPLKIKKIDVVTHRFYDGASIYDGIISFKTEDGDLAGYTLDPNATVLEFNGIQQEREFYTPVYETKPKYDSRIPDLRNTLMWAPDLKTDKHGKAEISFYTSDLRGKFAVIIQGITAEGQPGSSIRTFTVTP